MNMTWGKLFVHPINDLLSLNRLLAAFQTIITENFLKHNNNIQQMITNNIMDSFSIFRIDFQH